MTAIVEASKHSSYFDEELRQGLGQWCGRRAEQIGLRGPCTLRDFNALADGYLPGRKERIRARASEIAWYEVVIALPSTVSLLSAAEPRVVDWFRAAVRGAVPHLEGMLRVRDQRGGQVVRHPAGGGIIAEFVHNQSRAREPNLHVHLCVMNGVPGDETRRSICADELYRRQRILNAYVLAQVAQRLDEAGYPIIGRQDTFAFEVNPLIGLCDCSRRAAILSAVPSGWSYERRRDTNAAARSTRARKRTDTADHCSLAAVQSERMAYVAGCVSDAAARRHLHPIYQQAEMSLWEAADRYFRYRWIATDVDLLVCAVAHNWGAEIPWLRWHFEVLQPPAHLCRFGQCIVPKAEVDSMVSLRQMRLGYMAERPDRQTFLPPGTQVVSLSGKSHLARVLGRPCVAARHANSQGARSATLHLLDLESPSAWHPSSILRLVRTAKQAGGRRLAVAFHGWRAYSRTPIEREAAKVLQRDALIEILKDGPIPGKPFNVLAPANLAGSTVVEVDSDDRMVDVVAHGFAMGRGRPGMFRDNVATHCQQVRERLRDAGVLHGAPVKVLRLVPRPLRWWDEAEDVASMVIELEQNTRFGRRRERFYVYGRAQGGLRVLDAAFKEQRLIPADRNQPYKAYSSEEFECEAGDWVTVQSSRRTGASGRLSPGTMYQVVSATAGGLVLSNGVHVDAQFGHLNYAYATGRMKGAVIPADDSALMRSRLWHSSGVTLVTRNAGQLAAVAQLDLSEGEDFVAYLKRWAPEKSPAVTPQMVPKVDQVAPAIRPVARVEPAQKPDIELWR